MAKIGIIGGSGLYDPQLLQNPQEISVNTDYGEPSSVITKGLINDTEVLIIARHGKNHQFNPTQVNYRANISALKKAGATHIIATTACGSLREEIDRGDFVIIDQFIDFTKHRIATFFDSFENGMNHTAMAEPFNPQIRKALFDASTELGFKTHKNGTLITIEGPRFSTKAESKMFRLWGGDVINMSVATEACLANEAEIPYAVIAMSTDYDCWKEDEEPVTWEEILKVFDKNVKRVEQVLINTVKKIKDVT